MTIALLCPTKERSGKFQRMCDSARKMGDVKIYAAIQQDDIAMYSGYDFLLATQEWMPTCHKWNLLAESAMQNPNINLFMLAADDIIFATPLWDAAIKDHYNALENKIHVYALLDSRDENGTPHQIVTREFIEAMGWFCPPIFLHWMTDTWTTEIAKSAGVFTHLKDYLLIHDKSADKGTPDATHIGIREQGWHARDMWVAEHCQDWLEMQKIKLHRAVGKSIISARVSASRNDWNKGKPVSAFMVRA